jgi:crossover junction endodeoxyribonuclease RuvC
MRVLGIDPGSNYMGLACVEARGSAMHWIGHRVVKVLGEKAMAPRLKTIHEAVQEAIALWKPDAVAVEEVFFAKNAQSALKLGQARGAAIAAAAILELEVFEYPATIVKQAVTGSGRSEKEQVERMVRAILGKSLPAGQDFARADASDAVAVAICHLQYRHRAELLRPGRGEKRLGPALR